MVYQALCILSPSSLTSWSSLFIILHHPLCSSHPCLLANLTLACLRAFASAVSFFYMDCSFSEIHMSHTFPSFKSLHLSVRTSLTILQHYKYPLSPLPSHILKNPLSPCHQEETDLPVGHRKPLNSPQ